LIAYVLVFQGTIEPIFGELDFPNTPFPVVCLLIFAHCANFSKLNLFLISFYWAVMLQYHHPFMIATQQSGGATDYLFYRTVESTACGSDRSTLIHTLRMMEARTSPGVGSATQYNASLNIEMKQTEKAFL